MVLAFNCVSVPGVGVEISDLGGRALLFATLQLRR